MHAFFSRLFGVCRSLFEYIWGSMSALTATAVMLGVTAIGVHYVMEPQALEAQRLRCYAGLRNPAGSEPPQGITPLGDAAAAALPIAHIRFEHDAAGLPQRVRFVDAKGKTTPFPGSRVSEQKVTYDSKGRVLSKENRDADGAPAPDASGVATRLFQYDNEGRLTSTKHLDAAGKAVVPRMPGYAEQRITYDAQGRPLRVQHLDAKGHPIADVRGEETVEYSYDDIHGSSERCNKIKGTPTDNVHGVAVERTEHTTDGGTARRAWRNAEGKPVVNPQVGAAALLHEKGFSNGTERKRLCGADGVTLREGRLATEHVLRCDSMGHPEWECFNAADGLPCVHPRLGYAERVCEYSPTGHLVREHFWDALGNPATCYRKEHTRCGEGKYVLSLFTDGSTAVEKAW